MVTAKEKPLSGAFTNTPCGVRHGLLRPGKPEPDTEAPDVFPGLSIVGINKEKVNPKCD
jgi:hypothetical protein